MRMIAIMLALALAGCASSGHKSSSDTTPSAAELNTSLGLAYLQQGRYDLAREKLERAIELNPNLADAHHYLAQVDVQGGQWEAADKHYRKALSLASDDPMLRNNYGAFLCFHQNDKQGLNHILRAVKNPKYKTPELAYENAGLCALQLKDAAEAETHFRAALRINAKLPNALYQMAVISAGKKEYLQARAFLQRYFEISEPNKESLLLAIKVENQLGDKVAVQRYRQILARKYPETVQSKQRMNVGQP